MSTALQRAATDAAFEKIAELYAAMKGKSEVASQAIVDGVNLGRELGLVFKTVCNHEQMNLEFFQNHADRFPKGMDFGFVQRCEWMERNIKTPVKSYKEAKAAEQMLFLAFNVIPEPKRLNQQSAHDVETPYSWILTTFSSVDAQLKKYSGEFSTWDKSTKASVKEELSRTIKVLTEWERKLAA